MRGQLMLRGCDSASLRWMIIASRSCTPSLKYKGHVRKWNVWLKSSWRRSFEFFWLTDIFLLHRCGTLLSFSLHFYQNMLQNIGRRKMLSSGDGGEGESDADSERHIQHVGSKIHATCSVLLELPFGLQTNPNPSHKTGVHKHTHTNVHARTKYSLQSGLSRWCMIWHMSPGPHSL